METMVEVDRVEGRKKELKGRKRLRKLSRQYADDLKKKPVDCAFLSPHVQKVRENSRRYVHIHIEGNKIEG